MFIFGHIGIGSKIASPWSRNLPKAPLLIGMLLPDIIDKTLFYGTQLIGNQPEIISCTRTFGHTALLLILILTFSKILHSRWLAALSLGMATHLLLDCLFDRLFPAEPSSALQALTWPFLNTRFASFHYGSFGEHLHHLGAVPIIVAEIIGLALIGWDYWKNENRRFFRKGSSLNKGRRWRVLKH